MKTIKDNVLSFVQESTFHSVGDSVFCSIIKSVHYSVKVSVWKSVQKSVGDFLWNFVRVPICLKGLKIKELE